MSQAILTEEVSSGVAPGLKGVMADLLGDVGSLNLQIYGQIEQLARLIEKMKGDIAIMRQGESGRCDISSATDELDAVVADTEQAAGIILDAIDTVDGVADRLDSPDAIVLRDATTRICEACSFQDISGQRITKVVRTLRQVEEGLQTLLKSIGGALPQPISTPKPSNDGDATLLNGPQLPSNAQGQDDIDALLASFG